MEGSLFARELNQALASSGLAPEDVVQRLQRAGFFVFPGTFNEWCQGQSLPCNSLAFQLAGSMEDIFDVQRGKLCESLLYDLHPVKSLVPDEHAIPELVALPSESDGDDFEDSYSTVGDTDGVIESHRLVVKEEMRVSADRKTVLWNTIIGSLVPPVLNPSVEVGVLLEKQETPYQGKFILEVHGAYIGNESCVEHNGERSYKATLILTNDIVPGDIAFCSLLRGVVSQVEQTNLAWRLFRKELDYYSCTVLFEGQAPRSAEYVAVSNYDNRELAVTPLEVQNNCVKLDIRNFGQAGQSGYIRYTM